MRIKLLSNFSFGIIYLYLSLLSGSAAIAQDVIRTPADVYGLAQSLSKHTDTLRRISGVMTPWPELPRQEDKAPRHVLQKALEVLKKIGRLRQIKHMGAISIPPYPSRSITPNEVFDMVQRLNSEIVLLLPPEERVSLHQPEAELLGKTSNDVYRALWRVSLAFDPLLGVRGFTPNDVYVQTEQILEMVRFLRLTQNLPNNIQPPPRPTGKHPNHALQAAYELLAHIAKAEENLWIEPAYVPKLERRVIIPTDVYDALSNIIAELQRIKYRLGVERHFPEPEVKTEKSPDDVVQNLQWASEMMPQFPLDRPLYQYDPESLAKTSSDVYLITEHILDELLRYRDFRGIKTLPRQPPQVSGLQLKHVYQKTLEGLEKINVLRQQMQVGAIALPKHPLRKITSMDVFDLVVRLDAELQHIYNQAELEDTVLVEAVKKIAAPQDKTPSDVYANIWRISYLLDTVIGGDGYTPDDVYRESMIVLNDINLIAQHLKRKQIRKMPDFVGGYESQDVIIKARDILQLVTRIQDRAGLFEKGSPTSLPSAKVTPNDVFNMVGLIHIELSSLKLHLGISDYPDPVADVQGKTPSHVYQLLTHAHASLSSLLDEEKNSTQEAEQ